MKLSVILLAIGLVAAGPVLAQPSPPECYRLVWADEFEVAGAPDPDNWTFEEGFLRNGELQWYQADNALVENGTLVIEGRRERRENPSFVPGSNNEFARRRFINYTSASLTTQGLHAWQYGRFEVRARFPAEQGLWPAIWFLGIDGRWPGRGEIDLMEYYDNSVLANFAWAEAGPTEARWQARKLPLPLLTDDPDWDSEFHVWTMDWDEDSISLSLDGRLMNHLVLDTVQNHSNAPVANPFRQPHYLLLNLALGGQNGGPVRDTPFPARYEIDYVRVYQRTGEAE